MKVKYLRMKNFNAIFTVLNKKKLEIDFTRMKHDILLFIGTNGSCKTYILSNIHPFAYLGNVDVRNNQDLIIKDLDGEKEIHFENDNGDEYKIRHYYMHQKRGRKISSYIEKNGVELNTTGLVGTFNEIVELEFGIDIGFLRIIRLGSNVSNLVNLKSTERKEFGVKLLEEVDAYLMYNKRSIENSRNKNSELKGVVEKIKRLNIEDEILYENELDRLQKLMAETVVRKEDCIKAFYKYKGEVESSIDGTVEDLTDELSDIQNDMRKLTNELKMLRIELSKRMLVYIGEPAEAIETSKESLKVLETKHAVVSAEIEILSKSIVELRDEILDLDNKIKTLQSDRDIDSIKEELESSQEFVDVYSKYYVNFKPKCSRSELMEDIALMQSIHTDMMTLGEFSNDAKKMYMDFREKKKGVKSSCMKRLIKLSTELSIASESSCMDTKLDLTSAPEGCTLKNSCAYYLAYRRVEASRGTKEIEEDIDLTQQCIKLAEGIERISILLDNRKDVFPYVVKLSNIELDIMNNTITFYNFEEANNMVSFLERFTEYQNHLTIIDKLNKDLEYHKKQQDTVDKSLIERRTKITIDVSDKEGTLISSKKKRKKLSKAIDDTSEFIETLTEYKNILANYNETQKKLKDVEKVHESLAMKISVLQGYEAKKELFDNTINSLTGRIKELDTSIYEKRVKLDEYRRLRADKERLEIGYENTELIRDAVSPTSGVPLIYLHVYMSRARIEANRIIASVYGDSIKLNTFVINDKEFRIPYVKNGTEIDDVVYASQGELSVISLAISFALMEQFTCRSGSAYNILLLDEVDGPLDRGNSEKFLRILEEKMITMGCKQACMITHKQLFENYPVDVYITQDKDNIVDSFKDVNLIN